MSGCEPPREAVSAAVALAYAQAVNHKWVHTVEKVDQGFLDFLAKPLEVKLYVSPGAGSM